MKSVQSFWVPRDFGFNANPPNLEDLFPEMFSLLSLAFRKLLKLGGLRCQRLIRPTRKPAFILQLSIIIFNEAYTGSRKFDGIHYQSGLFLPL